jgi:hypothetical protein
MMMPSEYFQQMRPDRRRLCLIFREPTLRPPVLDEMMPDIERLLASVAQRYSDRTTPHLHFDEIVAEGRLKLAELIDRGHLDQQPTRTAFFKFLKASVNNQARSRVQKYRYTEKRTGVKPPPRDQRNVCSSPEPDEDGAAPEYHKNVELSLDDPDLNIQVPDEGCLHGGGMDEVLEDYESRLSEVEKLIFRQLAEPNELARCFATVDSYFNRKPGRVTVKIKNHHLAQGIGLSPELFEEAVLSIRAKIKAYRSMNETEQQEQSRYNATVAQLKEVFGLQIPAVADEMLVRRLLTLAARDQYSKVNAQVAEMLEFVGARAPRIHGDMLSCYGVLYQKNHRICNSCGLRFSCATEAANVGLSKIVISPKLLGARQMRIPAILPAHNPTAMAAASSDDVQLITYLDEHFKKSTKKGKTYYGHLESKSQKHLFCLGDKLVPLTLRFCTPSDELKKKLVCGSKVWSAPPDSTYEQLVALIEQHAKDTYGATG